MPCSTSGNAEDRRGNPSHQARPEGCITSVTMVQRGGGASFVVGLTLEWSWA